MKYRESNSTKKDSPKTGENAPGASILIPKQLASSQLHDDLEKYMADQRIKGRKLNKPMAVVQILQKFLTNARK